MRNTAHTCRGRRSAQRGLRDTIWLVVEGRVEQFDYFMSEEYLPVDMRQKANVALGGEHAWRIGDFEAVVLTAKSVNLASLGGQVQFILPEGTCEMHWINYDSEGQKANESWNVYVERSASEVLTKFRSVCGSVDFMKEANDWRVIREKIENESIDPLEYLWFVGYFKTETQEN